MEVFRVWVLIDFFHLGLDHRIKLARMVMQKALEFV